MDAFHAAAEGGQQRIINLFLDWGYHFPGQLTRVCFARGSTPPYRNLLREALPDHRLYRRRNRKRSSPDSKSPPAIPLSDFQDVFKNARGFVVSEAHETHAIYRDQRSYSFREDEFEKNRSYALEVAAAEGQERIVQSILANGKKLGVTSDHVARALLEASKNGHTTLAKLVMVPEIDLRSYTQGALEHAAAHGNIAILEGLLKYQETLGSESESTINSSGVYWPQKESTSDFRSQHNRHVSSCPWLPRCDTSLMILRSKIRFLIHPPFPSSSLDAVGTSRSV